MEETNRPNDPEGQEQEATIESDGHLFRCPKCGSTELLVHRIWLEDLRIFADGRIEWKPICPVQEEGFCCGGCGNELSDDEGLRISTYEGLIYWIFARQAEEVIERTGYS